jgi:hypothetical protein
MSPQLQIINVALTRLGAEPIASLTENTSEARIAGIQWDVARRACLRDHPWNFAVLDQELSAVEDTTEVDITLLTSPAGYVKPAFRYSYQLPTDYLRLLRVYNSTDYRLQGRRLLTDERYCRIKYVRDVEDTTEFSSHFDDLLAQRLASDMAFGLTKSQASADSMYGLYQAKLKTMRHVDAMEEPLDPIGPSWTPYLNVRY